jgi:hypothetical protein
MKVHYNIQSGVRSCPGGDWSHRASPEALDAFYIANKKNFSVGYSFTVQGITMIVTKITEKQKPGVIFTG